MLNRMKGEAAAAHSDLSSEKGQFGLCREIESECQGEIMSQDHLMHPTVCLLRNGMSVHSMIMKPLGRMCPKHTVLFLPVCCKR